MSNTYSHQYQVGDAVLADMNGAQIPGVISDTDGARLLVQLSQPWSDETGQAASIVSLTADKLSAYIESETDTAGQGALPG